jgi:hypothetical protein
VLYKTRYKCCVNVCDETKRVLIQEDRQCSINFNIQPRSHNQCCCGKAISITYPECVTVALVIQHAKCMHRIMLSSAACLALQYVSTSSHKRHHFRKKNLLNIKSESIFYTTLPEKLLILRRIKRDIIININTSSCKVSVTVVRF